MSEDLLPRVMSRVTPYARFLGINYTKATKDCMRAELTIREELTTMPGRVHGGVLMSLADNLGAIGTILNLPDGAGTTTIESKTNFLATIPEGERALAESIPLHRGKTTHVWQTTIRREDGKIAAIIIQTQLVLQPR